MLELGSDLGQRAAAAIARDEELAREVGRGESAPVLRVWEGGRAVVLPSRLRRLAGMRIADEQGREWELCARRSGGAAVAHGPGTLNVSLILPLRTRLEPSIDASYRMWTRLLDTTLREAYGIRVAVDAVSDAFCPGQHDAVAHGRKLAGIAQARRDGSVVVHGTILVHVARADYLRVIECAERLAGISDRAGRYDPERIVSLHELTGRVVSAGELATAIVRAVA